MKALIRQERDGDHVSLRIEDDNGGLITEFKCKSVEFYTGRDHGMGKIAMTPWQMVMAIDAVDRFKSSLNIISNLQEYIENPSRVF